MARVTAVFDEINITPLTDIFLVLLIIMMVVAPMMNTQQQDIKTPDLEAGQPLEPEKATVEVNAQGAYFINGEATPKEALTDGLKNWVTTHPAEPKSTESRDASVTVAEPAPYTLVLRADKQTKSEAVMAVFEAARDAGFKKLTVAGVPAQAAQSATAASP
ncbi:MAG: biopolymer transporter ExbD [Vampirovibrionales bacterium]|nr:biopolymer transporter ExbD [Vampirovibrionales bacterium]